MASTSGRRRLPRRVICRIVSKVLVLIASALSEASGSVPSFNLDVEYAGYWIGTVIYASLTVTLAILHFREPAANAFDPLVNPGAYSRLITVVGAYYGLSLVWIITSIFVHLTVKGADIRRRLVGLDAATKV